MARPFSLVNLKQQWSPILPLTTSSTTNNHDDDDDDDDVLKGISVGYAPNRSTDQSSDHLFVSHEDTASWLSGSFGDSGWSTNLQGQGFGFTTQTFQNGFADEEVVVPDGCTREALKKFMPWDNPRNILSARTTQLTEAFVYCGLLPLLCLVGVFTNVLSCAVFHR